MDHILYNTKLSISKDYMRNRIMNNLRHKKWRKSLDLFLEKVYNKLQAREVDWVIIGSVATVLQGCDVSPNDLDILVKFPESVKIISEYLEEYFHETKITRNSFQTENENDLWFSTKEKPIDISMDTWQFEWIFSRVLIEGVKVEIAHITAPKGHSMLKNGIWEAGPKIWSYIKKVTYNNYSIPVVPLEIQLGTNLNRNLKQRADTILEVLKVEPLNKELLQKVLSVERYLSIIKQMKGSLSFTKMQ